MITPKINMLQEMNRPLEKKIKDVGPIRDVCQHVVLVRYGVFVLDQKNKRAHGSNEVQTTMNESLSKNKRSP